VPYAVITVICAPDDGWSYHPKHVEQFTEIQYTVNSHILLDNCIYVFCIYLRTNSDLCQLQHKLIGFYNREEKCLLRGTDWVFK
jgi:hypothetical protein